MVVSVGRSRAIAMDIRAHLHPAVLQRLGARSFLYTQGQHTLTGQPGVTFMIDLIPHRRNVIRGSKVSPRPMTVEITYNEAGTHDVHVTYPQVRRNRHTVVTHVAHEGLQLGELSATLLRLHQPRPAPAAAEQVPA